jgi:hypothetical protein
MADVSIHIESFNTNVNGCRILCNGIFKDNNKIKYPPIVEYIMKLREPFKKKILISNNVLGMSKHIQMHYDATFQVKDSTDWTMVVTYITYVAKPLLIVCEEAVPDALWAKLVRGITFVHITHLPIINLKVYDCIFFSAMDELGISYNDYVYKVLQSVHRSTYTVKEHKEIMQELRVAKAGLAWTRIEEDTQQGNLYWYDPIEQNQGDQLSNKQISELFKWLSDQFQQGDN